MSFAINPLNRKENKEIKEIKQRIISLLQSPTLYRGTVQEFCTRLNYESDVVAVALGSLEEEKKRQL